MQLIKCLWRHGGHEQSDPQNCSLLLHTAMDRLVIVVQQPQVITVGLLSQAGKMRVPTSNEGLYCHLAKWARSDLEDPSTASKGNYLKATVFFGMVSAKLWSWVAPDATSTTLCPVLYLSSVATTKSCLWSSSQHCHRGVLWLVGFVFCFFFKGQKKLKTAKMNLHQNKVLQNWRQMQSFVQLSI